NLDADSLYELPLMLRDEGLGSIVCRKLGMEERPMELSDWMEMLEKERNPKQEVTIALVGKYVELHDAYLSVAEALHHGGIYHQAKVKINWVDSEELTKENAQEILGSSQGILVPGGFGNRGLLGKMEAIRYAREKDIPFFGICLGMQCAVIEFARNVLGWKTADSTEVDEKTEYPVIHWMPDQKDIKNLGGTMRLGAYECQIAENSFARKAYSEAVIWERHRHRFELNNNYREALTNAGLTITGLSPDGRLVEMVENQNNRWFVGVQFHPEFKSRPNRPHPLFRDFVSEALKTEIEL
ncbi:MAG TPA: CTP synthase, partial [Clostridium sp.]|nr:CTP synthase [Clostridium sp.]